MPDSYAATYTKDIGGGLVDHYCAVCDGYINRSLGHTMPDCMIELGSKIRELNEQVVRLRRKQRIDDD